MAPPPRERNRLLAALPPLERQRLQAKAERVQLAPGQILIELGDRPRHVFFPEGGMLSLLGGASSHRMLELAHVGDEGMAGISIALQGAWAPHRVMVQIPTAAWKIKAEALREELNRRGALQDLLLRYTYTLLRQVSQSVVCHTYHTIPQRLSRWLLSARDRIDSDTLQLTQTFVADLLGVRRTGVSAAEQELQDQDVIRIRHGKLRILNRRRLEALACECYGVDKAETGTLHEALSDAQLATSTRQRIVVQ